MRGKIIFSLFIHKLSLLSQMRLSVCGGSLVFFYFLPSHRSLLKFSDLCSPSPSLIVLINRSLLRKRHHSSPSLTWLMAMPWLNMRPPTRTSFWFFFWVLLMVRSINTDNLMELLCCWFYGLPLPIPLILLLGLLIVRSIEGCILLVVERNRVRERDRQLRTVVEDGLGK